MQGCDVAGVDVVVHWKLPTSISSFAQRAGWAARGYGRTRLAVLLAEKSAYDVGLDERQSQKEENSKKKKKGSVRKATTYPKSKDKNYTVNHGVQRMDIHPAQIDVPLDHESIDEGVYPLFQTADCHRKVIAAVCKNQTPSKYLKKFSPNY